VVSFPSPVIATVYTKLHNKISENSQDTNTLLASEGLLAIASSSSSVNEDMIPRPKSPLKASNSPTIEPLGKTVPHPVSLSVLTVFSARSSFIFLGLYELSIESAFFPRNDKVYCL
jgi:hypothetical protein